MLALVGGCLLLLPRSRGSVSAGLLLLSLNAMVREPALPVGQFSVRVLDVGQGSAIIVRTRRHTLLFDTAPGYADGTVLAATVVEPSLAALGVRTLDRIIISHGDTDHAGGLDYLRQRRPRAEVWVGPSVVAPAARRCRRGVRWQWDSVRFSMLHPPPERFADANDSSCVLLIHGHTARALLAGDVSRRVEPQLARALTRPVTLMLAPHHGSATSSSRLLLARARPRVVVASAARLNRYNHPHPEVWRAYCAVGARRYVTGWHGSVYWRSDAAQVRTARVRGLLRGPHWRAPPFEALACDS